MGVVYEHYQRHCRSHPEPQQIHLLLLRTGKCSLSVVRDFAMSAPGKISKNDLLYCPRLYQSMKNRKSKPVTIVPCQCGHGQVVTGTAARLYRQSEAP